MEDLLEFFLNNWRLLLGPTITVFLKVMSWINDSKEKEKTAKQLAEIKEALQALRRRKGHDR